MFPFACGQGCHLATTSGDRPLQTNGWRSSRNEASEFTPVNHERLRFSRCVTLRFLGTSKWCGTYLLSSLFYDEYENYLCFKQHVRFSASPPRKERIVESRNDRGQRA